MIKFLSRSMLVLAAAVAVLPLARADEAQIRKALPERLPNLPPIDEVTKTPIAGLYEVRIGSQLLYSDELGNHIVQGNVIDTVNRVNLTQAKLDKLSAFEFDKLPLKDAIVWQNGSGARKLAVFSDPNCGYCKRLEVDLQKLKNVTVYTFLIPVLGPDSLAKSTDIWCSKERSKTWLGWMLEAKLPAKAAAGCSTPIERNLALSRKHRVDGTPALVFSDNTRIAGAVPLADIEKQLVASSKP